MKWFALAILSVVTAPLAWSGNDARTNHFTRSTSATNDTTRVVGTLKRRSEMVTIMLATNGTRYTVRDRASGEILAEDIPEPDLAIQFPDVQRDLEHGIAGWDARY